MELAERARRQLRNSAHQIRHADIDVPLMPLSHRMLKWDGGRDPAVFALPLGHLTGDLLRRDSRPRQIGSTGALLTFLALALAFALVLAPALVHLLPSSSI